MKEDPGFLERLREEILRGFAETLAAFGGDGVEFAPMLGQLLTRLLVAAVLIALFGVVYLLLRKLLDAAMRRLAVHPDLAGPLMAGLRWLLFVVAALAIMAQFGVDSTLLSAVARAGLIALLFYVAWMVSTRLLINLLRSHNLDQSIEQLLRNVASVLIVVFGMVTVLSQFGFDIVSIVAGLGIVGLAVGFAAQSTLSNIIAGITLLIERPFRIGDWVRINDQDGKVMEIALRSTRLRTRDNIYMVIPNDSVASTDITNYSAKGALRVRVPIGIAYKENIAAARAVILPILEARDDLLRGDGYEPRVAMSALGDSSIDLVILFWIAPEQIDIQPRITAQILEAVKDGLDAAGIEIPFPHLQLFIDDAEGFRPVLEPLYPRALEPGEPR
ncbi:MAG: mechanosensitive ion channel family protein [Gammaproteobacteria bacterium]|nr:mechanosensitive ion channel family protein [Gammaproteobacteria bacterium]